jgi:hypothetical protein
MYEVTGETSERDRDFDLMALLNGASIQMVDFQRGMGLPIVGPVRDYCLVSPDSVRWCPGAFSHNFQSSAFDAMNSLALATLFGRKP